MQCLQPSVGVAEKDSFCFLAGFLTSWLTTKQSGAPYYYRGGVESDRELKVFRLLKAKLFCTLLRRGVCKLISCFLSPSWPVHAPFPHPVGHPPATVVARGGGPSRRRPLMLLRLHWSKSSVSWDRGGHMWGVMAKNPRMCVAVKTFVHEQYIVHWVIKRLVLFSPAAECVEQVFRISDHCLASAHKR